MSDPESLHLIDALTEKKGYYAAFYCSYGVDLAFFEEAVLRPLWQNQCRHHVIFMDGRRYADTIEVLRGSAEYVGQRYSLVPINRPAFQVFHPKLILLLGPEHGRLLVGSGNLTFTGFGQNHELFTCFDWSADQPESLSLFQDAWRFVRTVQARWGHNPRAIEVMKRTEYGASWLIQPGESRPSDVAFWHTLDEKLLDRLAAQLQGERVERLTIVTPFLDKTATAVAALYQCFQPQTLRLVLQHNQAVGDPLALSRLQAEGIPLALFPFGDDRRYLHAKLLLLETATAAYALTGSANCTRPALLATAEDGNVETAVFHRGSTPAHFNYLLPSNLLSAQAVAVEQIALRGDRLVQPEDSDDDETPAWIQLLDATVMGQALHLQIEWRQFTPAPRPELQLQFDTVPPRYVDIPAREPGIHSIVIPIADELGALLTDPLSVQLIARDPAGNLVLIRTPSLWITNIDAMDTAAVTGRYTSGRASDFLASMVAESENDWQDLYTEIMRLVALDVAQISRRQMPATPRIQKTDPQLPYVEKETLVVLAQEEAALAFELEETLARSLSRESELQAFFDHIHQRFPGKATVAPFHEKRPPVGTTRTAPKWQPSRHIRVRFINLVKKYITSLHNEEYMQHAPVPSSLHYYAIFQRIIQLLYRYHGLEVEIYLEYLLAINHAFFGGELNVPAISTPRLRRHLRAVWREEWMRARVPLYALSSLRVGRQLVAKSEDARLENKWAEMEQRCLSCLRIVIDWPDLRQRIETLTLFQEIEDIAHVYEMETTDLALQLLKLMDAGLEPLAEVFKQWQTKAAFAPGELADANLERLLYEANVDYRSGHLQLERQRNNPPAQKQIIQDLIFWARRAGKTDQWQEWAEALLKLLQQQGDEREVVQAIYKEAYQRFLDREYDLACTMAQEALTLAEKLNDIRMARKCQGLLSNISFFAR
jgi:hypothetical protein